MNVVYILWLRQLKRYYRSRARLLSSFAQPLLFLVALGFGFGPIFQRAGGGDYIAFLAPGIIAMSIIFTSIFSGVEIIYDKQFGFLKETLVAPIPRFVIMIGRTLGGSTFALLQGVIVFFVTLFIGFRPEIGPALLLAPLFMLLLSLFFTGIGAIIGSILEDMQAFPLIMNFLIMPLFFLSGALFPLNDVPQGLKAAARLDPLSYGVDGIRGALSGQLYYGFGPDLIILSSLTLITLFAGTYFFSKIEI